MKVPRCTIPRCPLMGCLTQVNKSLYRRRTENTFAIGGRVSHPPLPSTDAGETPDLLYSACKITKNNRNKKDIPFLFSYSPKPNTFRNAKE